ncbi:uncharacterized protein LOC133194821 [Saccostrea echinata]|uniref:uncharacterized protein LOC133194821 n=1 Tax=Saccostrea echinata TaxID=191078 RepID=UPI002A7F8D7D|nr:uncharacterized protein LOC133194821 [Saccostrea echinata]
MQEMPPKKMTKATGKAKMNRRKKAQEEEAQDLPQQPSPVHDPPEPADEGEEPPDQPAEPLEPDGYSEDEDEQDPSKQKSLDLTPEQEQELADFYQENPCFYDKSRSDFKNSKKKDRLIQEKAAAMNLTVADIRLWYRSQRTILGKVQKKKSGQKRCNLTARQKWVERNLGFLTRHIVHRPQGSQLGQVPADEEDEDSEPSSSVTQAPTRKKKRKKKDLDTAIIDLLEKTDRQTVDLTAKVDAAMSHSSDEKQAWVDWMLQALQPLPRHLWWDFTKEAFALVNKYQDRADSEQQEHFAPQPLQQPHRPATPQMVPVRPASVPTQWPQDLTQIQPQPQMYHHMYSQSSDVLAAAARVLNEW